MTYFKIKIRNILFKNVRYLLLLVIISASATCFAKTGSKSINLFWIEGNVCAGIMKNNIIVGGQAGFLYRHNKNTFSLKTIYYDNPNENTSDVVGAHKDGTVSDGIGLSFQYGRSFKKSRVRYTISGGLAYNLTGYWEEEPGDEYIKNSISNNLSIPLTLDLEFPFDENFGLKASTLANLCMKYPYLLVSLGIIHGFVK